MEDKYLQWYVYRCIEQGVSRDTVGIECEACQGEIWGNAVAKSEINEKRCGKE